MFYCTKQEKQILFLLAAVCAVGSVLHYALVRSDGLRRAVGLLERESIYPKLDLNTASQEDLVRLPYIGEFTAQRIVEYREENGPFVSVEGVRAVDGIPAKNIAKFIGLLKVGRPRLPRVVETLHCDAFK
jgi:competence ComEA-like helix-hairpin-helix protein